MKFWIHVFRRRGEGGVFSHCFDALIKWYNETFDQMLFDWMLEPCLNFVSKYCKCLLTCHPMHLTKSMLNLYSCMMEDVRSVSDLMEDIQFLLN